MVMTADDLVQTEKDKWEALTPYCLILKEDAAAIADLRASLISAEAALGSIRKRLVCLREVYDKWNCGMLCEHDLLDGVRDLLRRGLNEGE